MGLFGFGKKHNSAGETKSPNTESHQQRAESLFKRGAALFDEHNFKEAIPLILEAAELGYADAQNHMGVNYRLGEGVPKDVQKGIDWYRKAAAQDNVKALLNLGLVYKRGVDLPQDLKEAARLIQRSAELGHAKAQNNMGILYQNGEGVPQDYTLAAMWYQKSADQGWAPGQFSLGKLYSDGLGVPRDIMKAKQLWEASAKQGYKPAQEHLQQLNTLLDAAVNWYDNLSDDEIINAVINPDPAPAAAETVPVAKKQHNDSPSQPESAPQVPAETQKPPVTTAQNRAPLSQTEILLQDAVAAYNAGKFSTALELFKKAGKSGHAYAAYLAAEIYLLPEIRDYSQAESWATIAQNMGYQRATSLLQQIWADAGAHYLCQHEDAKEEYIAQNYGSTSKNFDQLWDEAPNCPDAKYAITLATAYLKKSAKAGNVSSAIKLAHYLYWNYSHSKDLEEIGEAEYWIVRAEQTGDSIAHTLAGWICPLYYSEMGLKYSKTDMQKAVTYFRKGAQRGYPSCMLNTAIVLYRIGDRSSLKEALQWATEVQKTGYKNTSDLIQSIKARL